MSSDLLLPEILSRIFSFLHIDDRRKVRLVCKKWNDCCNCPAILKREKIVFRHEYPLEDIDFFLRNCEQVRNTVEFQGLALDKLSKDAWRIIGENIYSLKLFECVGTTEVTKNIFLHCSNMHSFKSSHDLGHSSCHMYCHRHCLSTHLYSSAMWDELIDLNIERRKLINFHSFVRGMEYSDLPKNVIQKIFKIFPSIRNFGTGYRSYVWYKHIIFHPDDPRVSLQNTFNPALVQELTINVPCSGLWIQEFSEVPELKLQKLVTILENPTVSLNTFTQFLQNQRELKTLKITLSTTKKDYTKMILFKILSICTKLIDFRFKCDASILKIDEFYRVLQGVSESLIECFMIWCIPSYEIEDLMTFHDNFPTYLTPLTNKRLRTLKLEMGVGLPEEYCLPILQHFHDLYHLEISVNSDKILQTIFKYQIHLQTLVLRNIHNCTVFGITGEESDSSVVRVTSYSISRLQELKHLELGLQRFLNGLGLARMIQHINFPRLKCLRLSFWGSVWGVEEINLQSLPARIPSVEILILDKIRFSDDEFLLFCQHLPRLKHFISGNRWRDAPGVTLSKIPIDLGDGAFFQDRFSKVLRIFNFKRLEFKK